MVQQTLDATKNFIFDVRPMVLDDLGVVPTLRRMTRDRGRRAKIPVEFESLGQDRRLPMDMESTIFRILDEALAAYLSLAPERVQVRLDWTDELEARVIAERTPVLPGDGEPLPDVPTDDVPDAIREMIQDRHDARRAAVEAAEVAAIVVLPAAVLRDVSDRARSIGGRVEMLAGGGELRVLVPLPRESDRPRAARCGRHDRPARPERPGRHRSRDPRDLARARARRAPGRGHRRVLRRDAGRRDRRARRRRPRGVLTVPPGTAIPCGDHDQRLIEKSRSLRVR